MVHHCVHVACLWAAEVHCVNVREEHIMMLVVSELAVTVLVVLFD